MPEHIVYYPQKSYYSNYGRDYGADAWHYTSDSGHQPDLHHALLGKKMGGGIAYKGVLCRPDYGKTRYQLRVCPF